MTSMRRPGKPSVTGLCRPEDTIRGRGTRAIESDDVTPQRRGLKGRAAAAAEAQAGEQADEDEHAAPNAELPLRHRPNCGGVADRNQWWLRFARRAGDLLRGVVGASLNPIQHQTQPVPPSSSSRHAAADGKGVMHHRRGG